MQRNLSVIVATALMVTAATGFAQTADQSAQAAAQTTEQTAKQINQKDPADKSKGQDLVNPKTPVDTNVTAVGQDKSVGNNLVEPKAKGAMEMDARPDFKTIDMKKHGYVMASDVHNPWLKQNFAKCDADGDGKVTQAEYGVCSKQ